jgi:hypothetical protein
VSAFPACEILPLPANVCAPLLLRVGKVLEKFPMRNDFLHQVQCCAFWRTCQKISVKMVIFGEKKISVGLILHKYHVEVMRILDWEKMTASQTWENSSTVLLTFIVNNILILAVYLRTGSESVQYPL